MGRRRCCCGCVQFEDNFERADALDPGPNWEGIEIDAEAHIEDAKLKVIKGTWLWTGELPDEKGSAVLEVHLADMQPGDVFEVLFAWKDLDNFKFVRFEPTEWLGSWPDVYALADTMKATIGEVTAGVETSISDHDIMHSGCIQVMRSNNHAPMPQSSDGVILKIYFDRETFQLDSGAVGGDLWSCWGEGPWKRVGVRRPYGNTNPLYFDYFFASEHFVTNSECPNRGCRCGAKNCLPPVLLGTLEHHSGDAAPQIPDPSEITFYRRAWRDGYQWWSEIGIPGTDYMGGDPNCFGFWLRCTAEQAPTALPIQQYLLEWDGRVDCVEEPADSCWESRFLEFSGTLISAQCDPLILVYELDINRDRALHYDDPGVAFYDGPGGKYRLTITEPPAP
jgi:hypothetical protein